MKKKQRYKITIEYDGTTFYGWQKQKKHKSIQEQIEKAIFSFSHQKVEVTGSGRTDAGVHAFGQVAHFDLEKELEEHKVLMGINYYLKKFAIEEKNKWMNLLKIAVAEIDKKNIFIRDEFNIQPVSITFCKKVSNNFDARLSAKKRYYKYLILNRKEPTSLYQKRVWHVWEQLDVEKMKKGAKYLIGKHDFSSFRDSECQSKSPVKTLDEIKIYRDKINGQIIIFEFSARSFMHHMVRNIVGTLIEVGSGKIYPKEIKNILEGKNRCLAGQTAPAEGLYFMKVIY
ncbi:tRNA pseudouridine(38-40) synthase TruA [Pseudomonadota bacterium]